MEPDRPSPVFLACVDPVGRRIEAELARGDKHLWVRHPEVAGRVKAVRPTLEALD